MDGNGRWAEARGVGRQQGHRAGAERIRCVVERFAEHGVPMLTLFAFSTENWGRPRAEVDSLLRLAGHTIDRELALIYMTTYIGLLYVHFCYSGDTYPGPILLVLFSNQHPSFQKTQRVLQKM